MGDEFRLTEGTRVMLALGKGGAPIPGEIVAFFVPVVLFVPDLPMSTWAPEGSIDGAAAFLQIHHQNRPSPCAAS